MTHEDAGHYAAKHPAGSVADPGIAAALNAKATDGEVACRDAHQIARALQVTPLQVGAAIDLLEKRIKHCQLGLFGYRPRRKILEPAESVGPVLSQALARAASGRRVTCEQCWQIADALGLERLRVAAACEKLGLKIKPCQLGAF